MLLPFRSEQTERINDVCALPSDHRSAFKGAFTLVIYLRIAGVGGEVQEKDSREGVFPWQSQGTNDPQA